jgi:ABC-type multidrug transport system permease subunit
MFFVYVTSARQVSPTSLLISHASAACRTGFSRDRHGAPTLVRERERAIWEAFLATPVDALDALVGKLTPYVLIGTLQGAIVIAIARLLFALPPTVGLGALLAALPMYAGAHLILGFALSALAESQMQAMQGAANRLDSGLPQQRRQTRHC